MDWFKKNIGTIVAILSLFGVTSISSFFTIAFKAYDWHNSVNETIKRQEVIYKRMEALEEEKQVLINDFKVELKRLERRSKQDSIDLSYLYRYLGQ